MEPKRVNPLIGMLNLFQALGKRELSDKQTALTTELPNHTVDTCLTRDTGLWETGIAPSGQKLIIVEQYPDEQHAQAGHAKWVTLLTDTPDLPLADIDRWRLQE